MQMVHRVRQESCGLEVSRRFELRFELWCHRRLCLSERRPRAPALDVMACREQQHGCEGHGELHAFKRPARREPRRSHRSNVSSLVIRWKAAWNCGCFR